MFQNPGKFVSASLTIGLLLCAWVPAYGEKTTPAAKRHVALDGQSNFRDLGGYKTKDGRTVKWGQIYRSGELPRLSDEDISKLDQLRIKSVVNFLTDKEIEAHGKDRLSKKTHLIPLPIEGVAGDFAQQIRIAIKTADFSQVPATLNPEIHRLAIRDENAKKEYAKLLRAAADPTKRPLVFHCSHGVHRTGTAAAILLSALGVPWETIRQDYLLSNKYRKTEVAKRLEQLRQQSAKNQKIPPDQVDMTNFKAFYVLQGQYIDAARDEAVKRYGSMENYIREGLGVDDRLIATLRDELLNK